ncbi:MAG: hypothetical protein ACFCUN_05560 [Hyphomicrobiaceae bacterium]
MCKVLSITLALTLVIGLAVGTPTGAQALDLARVLSSPKPCFKVIHTAEHLAAHPSQVVGAIGMEASGSINRSEQFQMTFSVRRRSDRARFQSAAQCGFTSVEQVRCNLERDGGTATFRIGELNGNKRIRLETSELRFEGSVGIFKFGPSTDDAVFYLGAYAIHHCPV